MTDLPEGFVPHEGTYTDRCDYCQHWAQLSNARVMGWCERTKQKPKTPAVLILLAPSDQDQVTAYNQLCDAYRPTRTQEDK